MSGTTPALSLDAMIQADRRRKQAETLANEMLGSGRKKAMARGGASIDRKATASPVGSLASRVGVQKRSTSNGPKPNINGKWNHDLHDVNSPKHAGATAPRFPRPPTGSSVDKNSRTYASLQKNVASVLVPSAPSSIRGGAQMSIRGMAATGPSVVIASNFAPGTTAADIEAAMAPVGGEVTSCHLIATNPTVMAEIVFVDRDGAQNVIATFNNQKADGRILYVYMKQGGPSPLHISKSATVTTPAPITTAPPMPVPTPTGPRLAAQRGTLLRETAPVDPPPYDDQNVMEVDEEMADDVPLSATNDIVEVDARGAPQRDDNVRQMRGENGRWDRGEARYGGKDGRGGRGGRTDHQDGRYGFGEQYDRRDGPRDGPRYGHGDGGRRDYERGGRDQRGLYSDGMYRRDAGYQRR